QSRGTVANASLGATAGRFLSCLRRRFVLSWSVRMTDTILGWDVGGANVKVARISDRSHAPSIVEQPFPLWREFDRLPAVLASLAGPADPAAPMAVTMTGELADCFVTKREGVRFIVGAFERAFPASPLFVYGVDGRFHTAAQVRLRPHEVAAANWMATAALVA